MDIDIEERQRFHFLQTIDAEQHASEVRSMSRAVLFLYIGYLGDLQRMSVEEYEAMFGRTLSDLERSTFELRTGGEARGPLS